MILYTNFVMSCSHSILLSYVVFCGFNKGLITVVNCFANLIHHPRSIIATHFDYSILFLAWWLVRNNTFQEVQPQWVINIIKNTGKSKLKSQRRRILNQWQIQTRIKKSWINLLFLRGWYKQPTRHPCELIITSNLSDSISVIIFISMISRHYW